MTIEQNRTRTEQENEESSSGNWRTGSINACLAFVMELVGVSSLPFAVGLYLPLSTSMPIMAGGAIRAVVDRRRKRQGTNSQAESSSGVLFSSDLLAGAAIMGFLIAMLTITGWQSVVDLSGKVGFLGRTDWVAVVPFVAMVYVLHRVANKDRVKTDTSFAQAE